MSGASPSLYSHQVAVASQQTIVPRHDHGDAMQRPTRRQFLTTTALTAGGAGLAVLAAGGRSAAFSIEPGDAALTAQYQAALACRRVNAVHARLHAEAAALMAGRDLTDTEREMILAAFVCPVCGCPPVA
jgi:hypothetical protein